MIHDPYRWPGMGKVNMDRDTVRQTKTETIPCQCGKKMIRRKMWLFLENTSALRLKIIIPPEWPEMWWCGGCRKTKSINGRMNEKELEEVWVDVWSKAQD